MTGPEYWRPEAVLFNTRVAYGEAMVRTPYRDHFQSPGPWGICLQIQKKNVSSNFIDIDTTSIQRRFDQVLTAEHLLTAESLTNMILSIGRSHRFAGVKRHSMPFEAYIIVQYMPSLVGVICPSCEIYKCQALRQPLESLWHEPLVCLPQPASP